MNWVFLMEHLGRGPELRRTSKGKSVCHFSLATHRSSQSSTAETDWHQVVAWERTAELCSQFLGRGSKALVVGRVQTSSYEDNAGQKRRKTQIIASQVKFMERRGDSPAPTLPAFTKAPEQPPDDIPF